MMLFGDAVESYLNRINAVMAENDKRFESLPYYSKVVAEMGKKYIRLARYNFDKETGERSGGSCYGFIVAVENDNKFDLGDILKANSWKAPARNFVRGRVFTLNDDSDIRPYSV